MSEVTENSGLPTLTAGNTVATLQGTDVLDAVTEKPGLPSAADLDYFVKAQAEEQVAKEATSEPATDAYHPDYAGEEENTFDVSRAEFGELQDAFLRFEARIKAFNANSPHKI